jgi:Right handed beta helix region/Bacterial Ig-like domain (group 2)
MKKLLIFILLMIPLLVKAQTVLTVTGQTITSAVTGYADVYDVARSSLTTFTFSNNSMTAVNTTGHILNAGDEDVLSTNFNLNGEVITGNKLVWNGTDLAGTIVHGIFTGYNINALIKYNYLNKVPMAIIRKSDGSTNTSGGVAYNVVSRTGACAVAVKGMNGVLVYNNTFYSDEVNYTSDVAPGTWRGLVEVYENTNMPDNAPSTGCKIKNNIFYTVHQIYNIAIYEAADVAGFESDYNIFYCEAGTPIFNYLGSQYTFAQWQALGYDAHSVVVNPNFVNTTTLVPTARLDYGTNLGATWQTGLATSATWAVGSAPATAVQNGNWQVGAYVFASSSPTYYVSTTGSDSNPGTISSPWGTWQYGFNHIAPGDVLYIRGGTYTPTSITTSHSRYCAVVVDSKTGTSGANYQVFAYPGETPILDGSNITGTGLERYGILLYNSSYWHLKGLTIQNVKQPVTGVTGGQGILIQGDNAATNNTIELCTATLNGGPGMGTREYVNETLFLNCDSHDNFDAYSGSTPGSAAGGNADGFDVGDGYNASIIRFTGCRSWNNGDDGFDMYQHSGYHGIYYLTNCWAWNMGFYPGTSTPAGDGSGFKLGQGTNTDGLTHHYLYNCVSYANQAQGFDQNVSSEKSILYNCIACDNGTRGYDFEWYNVADILRNNISYANGSSDAFQSNQTADHNSWNGHTITNADFASISSASLTNARQSSGNLPVITFLHLANGSGLIHTGIAIVGLTLDGDGQNFNNPPSLGPWEYGSTPGVILTTDLTIASAGNATTIATNGGTLQFSVVVVVPSNATDQTVNWSVVNGTGTATISGSGLLTATGNGTVTVWGYSHDGSGAYDFKQITISNQLTTPPVTKVWASKGKIWHLKGKVISQRR